MQRTPDVSEQSRNVEEDSEELRTSRIIGVPGTISGRFGVAFVVGNVLYLERWRKS